jgi:hypothetical protein
VDPATITAAPLKTPYHHQNHFLLLHRPGGSQVGTDQAHHGQLPWVVYCKLITDNYATPTRISTQEDFVSHVFFYKLLPLLFELAVFVY